MSFDFAVELKKKRIETRKTQLEFCRVCGVNQHTYKAWESGRAVPNFENFNRIVDWLENNDCLTDDLIEVYERSKMGVLADEIK